MCHRGGLSPLFVETDEATATSLAVSLVLAPLVWLSFDLGRPDWRRMALVAIPASGLAAGHTHLDRYVMLPVATWYLSRGSRLVWRGPVALAVASAVAVAAGADCDAAAVVASDAVALALAAAHLLAGPHPPWAVMGSLAEASAIMLVLVTSPGLLGDRESHMTWWGLVALAVFDYARARGTADYVYVTMLGLQAAIVVGVWWMSATRCDLLADAQSEVGSTAYFLGNGAMHYWPSLRILLYRPRSIQQPARQAVAAVGAIAIYLANTNPTEVYGCQNWLTTPVVLAGFAPVVVGVAVVGAVCGTYIYPTPR